MATFSVTVGDQVYTLDLSEDGRIIASINGSGIPISVKRVGDRRFSVFLQGRSHTLAAEGEDGVYQVMVAGKDAEVRVESERTRLLRSLLQSAETKHALVQIRAPMPALVVKIEVGVGEEVRPGQGLLILEAMKMENEIKSHRSGTIREVCVVPGKTVEKGELLVVIE